MAHLLRLTLSALLLCAAALAVLQPQRAHAAFPPTETYTYTVFYDGNRTGSSTAEVWAAVRAYVAGATPWYPREIFSSYDKSTADPWASCTTFPCSALLYVYSPGGYGGATAYGVSRSVASQTCPANSTLVGGSCVCAAGYVEEGSSCVPPNPCAGNDVLLSASFGTVLLAKGQTSACFNGCQVNFKSGYEGPDFYAAGTDGVLRGHVPVGQLSSTNTVGACGAESPLPEADPKTAAELPCPIGKIPGTASMNGVTVTVCSDPIKTETSGTKTTNESTPEGPKVTTENKSTQCQDGKCTTTTTTTVTHNGSSTTSTRSTQQGQGEFCAENPKDKACKGSGFGGTCQQGFTCDGDAISCATAKAVNDQYCSFKEAFDVGDDAKSLANRVMGGTEVADPKANATVIDVGVFDQSNPLSSTCPGDVPIQLSGFTMVLPLASGCSWFQMIGNMMVLVSLFGATVFVLRGV